MSLDNAQHELFAQRYAAGASATSAYVAAGYEGKGRSAIASAHKLLKHPKVRVRILALKSEIAATLINCAIREKNSRLEALQRRWEKLDRVIEQRAVRINTRSTTLSQRPDAADSPLGRSLFLPLAARL